MENNLKQRIYSALILMPLVISVIYFCGAYLTIFAILCAILMLREWFFMNQWFYEDGIITKQMNTEIALIAFTLISGFVYLINVISVITISKDIMQPIMLSLVLFLINFVCFSKWIVCIKALIILFCINKFSENGSISLDQIIFLSSISLPLLIWLNFPRWKYRSKVLSIGVLYITIPMLFIITKAINDSGSIFTIQAWQGSNTKNLFKYAIWILSVVWSSDIFAYFGGRLIGGAKLAPSISPKKTLSGAITGIIVTLIITHYITAKFLPCETVYVDIMTFLMCVASILGDLIESKAKRMLGVKDSGNIIPGHGGICDRLDSLLFVLYLFIAYDVLQYLKILGLF